MAVVMVIVCSLLMDCEICDCGVQGKLGLRLVYIEYPVDEQEQQFSMQLINLGCGTIVNLDCSALVLFSFSLGFVTKHCLWISGVLGLSEHTISSAQWSWKDDKE